jgi:hypothetical protein
VTIERRTDAPVDLVLRPGARVVGRLVDGDDRAVAARWRSVSSTAGRCRARSSRRSPSRPAPTGASRSTACPSARTCSA